MSSNDSMLQNTPTGGDPATPAFLNRQDPGSIIQQKRLSKLQKLISEKQAIKAHVDPEMTKIDLKVSQDGPLTAGSKATSPAAARAKSIS